MLSAHLTSLDVAMHCKIGTIKGTVRATSVIYIMIPYKVLEGLGNYISQYGTPGLATVPLYAAATAYDYYRGSSSKTTGSKRTRSSGPGKGPGGSKTATMGYKKTKKTAKKKFRRRFKRRGCKKLRSLVSYISSHPRTPYQYYLHQQGYSKTWAVNEVEQSSLDFLTKGDLDDLGDNMTFLQVSGGVLGQSVPTPGTAMHDIGYERAKIIGLGGFVKVQMRNAREHPCVIYLYWYKCINSTAYPPSTLWLNRVDELLGNNGYEDNTNVNAGYLSAYVRKYWKLLKKTKLILAPGEMQEFWCPIYKFSQYFNDNDLENSYIKNCSYALSYRMEGVPVHDATTETNVGLGSGQVDMVIRQKMKYCFEQVPFQRTDQISNALGSITTEEGIAPQGDVTEEN